MTGKYKPQQLIRAAHYANEIASRANIAYWMDGRDESCKDLHVKWMLESYEALKDIIEGEEE